VPGWVTDRLWTGIPPRHRTRHPGLLSSSLFSGQAEMSTRRKLGSKQAHQLIHQPVSVVSQCGADAWLKGLASEDQRRLTGSGSALEVCSQPYALQMAAFALLDKKGIQYEVR